jgi:hypothetical protein
VIDYVGFEYIHIFGVMRLAFRWILFAALSLRFLLAADASVLIPGNLLCASDSKWKSF